MVIPSDWIVPSHAVLVTTLPTYSYAAGTAGLYIGNAIRGELGLPSADQASCNDLCISLQSQRGCKIGHHGGVPKYNIFNNANYNVRLLVKTLFPDVDVDRARFKIIVSDMGAEEGIVQIILVYKP